MLTSICAQIGFGISFFYIEYLSLDPRNEMVAMYERFSIYLPVILNDPRSHFYVEQGILLRNRAFYLFHSQSHSLVESVHNLKAVKETFFFVAKDVLEDYIFCLIFFSLKI